MQWSLFFSFLYSFQIEGCCRQFPQSARIEDDVAFLSIHEDSEDMRLWNFCMHKRRYSIAVTFSDGEAFGNSPIGRPIQATLFTALTSAPYRDARRQCIAGRLFGADSARVIRVFT